MAAGLADRHSGRALLARFRQHPLGLFGLVLCLCLIFGAVFADQLAAADPVRLAPRDRFLPPSWTHPMGTDHLGRDIFARVLHGGRVALTVALVSVVLSLGIGGALGMMAAYGPRWLDNALMLVFDAIRSFPTIMLALAIVTLFTPSLTTVVFVVVLTSTPDFGRVVRTHTLALKASAFVEAERSLGAGPFRIVLVHLVPNIAGPVFILASMEIPVVIGLEAGLGFLGLGVRPPVPTWGSILNDGYTYIQESAWLVLMGGAPVILATLGFTFVGEALRDMLDPRGGHSG